MKCPECNSENIGIVDNMPDGKRTLYRRRKCKDCGVSFRTVEIIDNGSEAFAAGYSRAYKRKRPWGIKKEKQE